MEVQNARLCVLVCILTVSAMVSGQNLIPNPSFEVHTYCPNLFSQLDFATPWYSPTDATPEYFNSCAITWIVDVPINYWGEQAAHSGEAYAGIFCRWGDDPFDGWFEYISAPIITTLTADQAYHVQFWVNLPGKHCATDRIGAHISVGPLDQPGYGPFLMTPQIEWSMGFLNDTTNWTLIEGCFVAQGGEDHITIGNFHSYGDTNIEFCDTPLPFSNQPYYFIDDVSLVAVPLVGLVVDVPEEASACYTYTIEPEAPQDVHYLWNTGATTPTLTVTETGLYKVTIYDDECNGGKDSIYVTILDQPDVAFNPEDTVLCAGESIVISLDPMAGDYLWNDGSTAPQYTITTAGHYVVTLDDGCDLTTDEIDVDILYPPAAFSLGNDTILCQGTEIEIEFDPLLGDFIWQDGSESNSILIYQGGTYSLTISNMCGSASASLVVEELMPVQVNLGLAQDILCDFETLAIDLDPTHATYLWQDGSTSSSYQISESGVYTVTMTHACGESIDSIIIQKLQVPQVTLGDSIVACPGDSIYLMPDSIVANYTWQDGSNASFFVVTTSGTYSLTVENVCGMDIDEVVIWYEDTLAFPDLGPDFSLCPGEESILHVEQTEATFLWQDMSTADSMLINAAGTYFVLVTNSCQSLSDTVVVTLGNMPPSITLPDQISLCQGSSQLLDPIVTGVTYTWSDGSHDPTLLVSNAGTYSLTVTNACGSDVDTVYVLDGGPLPVVSIGPDITICTGELADIHPVSSNVTAWLWSDSSTDTTYTTSLAGQIYVAASNGCGTAYDTLSLDVLPLTPTLSLGPDMALCTGDSEMISVTLPNVDVLWSDGSTADNYLVTTGDTQVYATITNGCGESSDTIDVTLLPAITPLDLGVDQSLCPGEVLIFDPGISGVHYLWQDGSTSSSFQTTQQGIVILSISNSCGTSTDTVVITESTDGPQVDLGPDVQGCEGEMITIPSGISGVSYLWQDGSTANVYIAATSGWVYLTVSNICGMDTDSLFVDISGNIPTPFLGADTTICAGTTLLLVSDASAITSTAWQDGSTAQNYLVTTPGTYVLTESNRCGTASDDILVSFLSLPSPFYLGADTSICFGEVIVLTAPVTTNTLQWQDGSNASTIHVDQAGTYSLQMTNLCGSTTDEIDIDVNIDTPQLNLASPVVWCPGDQITLDAEQFFPANYLWSTGENNASITVSTPGIYSIEVLALCGSAFGEVEVVANNECNKDIHFFIPNIFSPNNDQLNDLFFLSNNADLQVTSMIGSIYDRWGNLVFSSSVIPFVWDGMFSGKNAIPGVYVYQIQVAYMIDGEEMVKMFTGDVTLIR